jgi:hypothetical protein
MKRLKLTIATLALIAFSAMPSTAQQYKYETPIAPGIAVPDKIESSIGTLKLRYGYPEADTVEKIYDNLDRSRALQAYLMAIPIVNQAGMRDSLRKFRPVEILTLGRDGELEDGAPLERGRQLQSVRQATDCRSRFPGQSFGNQGAARPRRQHLAHDLDLAI